MLDILLARLRQGHRTVAFPDGAPILPERFRGRPEVEPARCRPGCNVCSAHCPTEAISHTEGTRIDLARCLFCGECERACSAEAIRFGDDYRLAAKTRSELVVGGAVSAPSGGLDARLRNLFGRSLKLRQVSAGGCNACEADTNVLSTIVFDLGRFGIQFVASPRHADGLLITGPVPLNMELALRKCYEAVPEPKIVIAVGACAITGGPYAGQDEVLCGADARVPVDLYIPGCPPHPLTILDGLLRALGRG